MHVTHSYTSSLPEILLIEDSKTDRDLFALALKRSGVRAQVAHAESVTVAVLRLNRMGTFVDHPLPALVILDLSLAGQNGLALLRLLRRWHAEHPIPVVVLTGSHVASNRLECEALGVDAFQVKPTLFADLVTFVSSLPRFFTPSSHQDLAFSHVSLERTGASMMSHRSSLDGGH